MRRVNFVLALTLGAAILACNNNQGAERRAEEQQQQSGATTAGQNQGTAGQNQGPTAGVVTVADITGNIQQYAGQQVTVEGELERRFNEQVFKLDEGAVAQAGIDNDLMVVSSKGKSVNVPAKLEGKRVRVTGTVRPVAITEIENEIGWDLDRQVEVELESLKAVLVADSVQPADTTTSSAE